MPGLEDHERAECLPTGVVIISREKGRSYGQLKEDKHVELRELGRVLEVVIPQAPRASKAALSGRRWRRNSTRFVISRKVSSARRSGAGSLHP
jgi:hypothetical protein